VHDEKPSWRTQIRLDLTTARLDKHQFVPVLGRVVVTTPAPLTNIFAAQVVEVTGVLSVPNVAAAEGTFDYRTYLKQQDIYYQLKASSEDDWQIIASPRQPPLAERFRTWAKKALALGLPSEDESLRLEWALALGWKAALTEEVSEPFVQAATYHIFAVDGLRMAIIFGIFFGLFRALRIPRAVCGLVLLPLIWFYVALTGWPASAIRASVMLSVVIIAWALKRPGDVLNSLLTAALLILSWEPRQLFQAGFQLSFFVVLCLLLILPPLHELFERLTAPDPWLPISLRHRWSPFIQVPVRYTLGLTLTSFAAWVGSLPLVACYFHIVTPVSTPANIVAVPLCGLVLISNIAALLFASWFPAATELFNQAGWFLMESIRVSSHWFANWPKAYVYVATPTLLTCILYYALLLGIVTGLLVRRPARGWKLAAVAAALAIWGWQFWQNSSLTRLTALAVNGGTALLCDAPGHHKDFLIDAGTTNSVQYVIKPFLRAQGINHLPGLLVTHGDLHHVGGAQMISDVFGVQTVWASPLKSRSTTYRRTLDNFSKTPGCLHSVAPNQMVAGWTVLHPDAQDRFTRADDAAIVLRRNFSGFYVLLLSDLGRMGQEALLARTSDLHADIVIAGLPSTGEPLCDPLLDAIQPRVLIVTDLEFPVNERASARLRERLQKRNIPTIYTRFSGAVTLEFGRARWELRTMSGERMNSAFHEQILTRLGPSTEPNAPVSDVPETTD
jgi:ComEC/Rec2-related protein